MGRVFTAFLAWWGTIAAVLGVVAVGAIFTGELEPTQGLIYASLLFLFAVGSLTSGIRRFNIYKKELAVVDDEQRVQNVTLRQEKVIPPEKDISAKKKALRISLMILIIILIPLLNR